MNHPMDHSRRMYQTTQASSYPSDGYPANYSHTGYPWPRTSNSRNEDPMSVHVKTEMRDQQASKPTDGPTGVDDGMHSTSDFVKKLFKMLEEPSFQHIVSWGPHGNCFVVKDMTEFTKTVLPRMFKHQNFASFVRQLNKYDFHKVKNTDDSSYGDQSWTFRHPDFHADRPDALDNIKRKVPASRKASVPQPTTSTRPIPSSSNDGEYLQTQIERLTRTQEEMSAHVRNLERNYHDVLVEMVGFQRNMAQQDGLMQNLIQYFLQSSRAQADGASPSSVPDPSLLPPSDSNPFLPQRETLRMVHPDAAGASLQQMNEMSRLSSVGFDWGSNDSLQRGGTADRPSPRPPNNIWTAAANAGLINPDGTPRVGSSSLGQPATPLGGTGIGEIKSRGEALQRIEELQRMRMGMASAMGINIPQPSAHPFQAPSQSDLDDDDDEEMVMPTVSASHESSTSPRSLASPPSNRSPADQASSLFPSPSTTTSTGFAWPEENSHEGLQVYTVGHLLPKDGNWGFDQMWDASSQDKTPSTSVTSPQSATAVTVTSTSSSSQKLRVRRSTYVPGWAVPPRVLLVDDDAVSRKLSSKFLQVFGCAIDVAVDGVGAVNKMNLEKYDLVLMDIVMPKLDGVSATSLIRKFDPMTPIISMTSNSKPNEIMTYYSSGMNDILPKPFTKEGLLNMLEKHLSGLHEIGRASTSIPRQLGATSSGNVNELMPYGAAEDSGRVNPLAGMGLTDEQYNSILQNIVGADTFGTEKRNLEEDDDGRQGKRGRFEVVE